MNRYKEKLIPLSIIIMGIYLVFFAYYLRIEIPFALEIAQIIILFGILLFGFQELRKRLSNIEQELKIDSEYKVSKAKIISNDIANEFLRELKEKQYIYKASIYLSSSSMDNLFLIQNLLSNTKVDSKVRLLVNTFDDDKAEQNNLDKLITKRKFEIDLRILDSSKNKHYSIIILDTEVWIINNFGNEIEGNLLFSISSYNQQGKSFIELFNKLWEESTIYSDNQN